MNHDDATSLNIEPPRFESAEERDRFIFRLYNEERFGIDELGAAFRMTRRHVTQILDHQHAMRMRAASDRTQGARAHG